VFYEFNDIVTDVQEHIYVTWFVVAFLIKLIAISKECVKRTGKLLLITLPTNGVI